MLTYLFWYVRAFPGSYRQAVFFFARSYFVIKPSPIAPSKPIEIFTEGTRPYWDWSDENLEPKIRKNAKMLNVRWKYLVLPEANRVKGFPRHLDEVPCGALRLQRTLRYVDYSKSAVNNTLFNVLPYSVERHTVIVGEDFEWCLHHIGQRVHPLSNREAVC